MSALPLPQPDRDSSPWWAAAAEGRLAVQICSNCARLRWPARSICNRCGSLTWTWIDVSGAATVASWIVNRHQFIPDLATPYVVVLARLDEQEDILIPGSWAGDPAGTDLGVGVAVHASFETTEETSIALLKWQSDGSLDRPS